MDMLISRDSRVCLSRPPVSESTESYLSHDSEHDFEELWLRKRGLLWPSLLAYTGGRTQVAEDALAEAFAQAMARGVEIRDPVAWIHRAALRLAAKELKRERQLSSVDHFKETKPYPEGNPGLQEVLWALRQLPPNQRTAVVLHYEMDLPVSEISRLMGISAATVKVHLHRGRSRLRRLLEEEER
jgi:RNA polymerase sigma-70 factor (ECF subfamily)